MIVGVLLAAGQARRFGADKLAHPLADGTPIAVAAARHLLAALDDCIAVVRPDAVPLETLLREAGMPVTVCPRARDGMGTSLAHAVRATRGADGWVVALADMPFVRPETIRTVAAGLASGAAVVATTYRGQRGHPVGFSAEFLGDLESLSGDEGAREVLKANVERLLLVEVDDAGVVRDIDTPGDLERP